jgi:type I restriction enzyme M protein
LVHETEVHAYAHILKELRENKGWGKEQVHTQVQIRKIDEIVKYLKLKIPENIVQINSNDYYVIEAKSTRVKLSQALQEAREDYSDKLNQSKKITAKILTGIAGNEDEGFIAQSEYFHNGKWEIITENDAEITGLLSKSQVERILESDNPHLKDTEISESDFFKAAEKINGLLHENAIHKDYRARFMSAILLALSDKSKIDLNVEPMVLVDSINSRADLILKKYNKSDFSRFIHIDKPLGQDSHDKLKTAIVQTIESLMDLNIHSAMKSGKDVLGKFYEVFLKYGNGAKDIGIVLTPRHITRFAVEVLDVNPNDLVLDPTCGTGGFLIAAFDEVKKKCKSEKEFEKFRQWGIYGIEEQNTVVSLALVNIIFRQYVNDNVIKGNCFEKWLNATSVNGESVAEYVENEENRVLPITKVLMNPPFPKKKTKVQEFLFVEYALKQMQDEGLLFSVLPYPCLIKPGKYLEWRKRLLKENTILSVITFPDDLFYPVGVHTAGIIIKKGVPHDKSKDVFWIRAINDGHKKSKGRRLENKKIPNDYEKIMEPLKSFIKNQDVNIPNKKRFYKTCPIDFSDNILELVPEYYLDDDPPTMEKIQSGMDDALRSMAAYMIRHKIE